MADAGRAPSCRSGSLGHPSAVKRKPEPTELIFPGEHRELCNEILGELGLKFDRDGNRRPAYSRRHTYIWFRLMEVRTDREELS